MNQKYIFHHNIFMIYAYIEKKNKHFEKKKKKDTTKT